MSELKTYKMVDEKYCTDCVCVIPSEAYIKSEADKVIAELKGQVNGFKNRSNLWHYNAVEEHKKFVQADKVIAHNKYKRCLAMANICESNVIWVKGCSEWRRWKKWHKRWLELAEKFKETK